MIKLDNITNVKQEDIFTHYPHTYSSNHNSIDLVDCENLLSKWFGAPVILLSSGRAGIQLALKAMGFHQYQSRLKVPKYLSTCVLNAITPFAFPVDYPSSGTGSLVYHQYGFSQLKIPTSANIIEDCAHSFFSTSYTGVRDWVGDVAIFSLPKFFDIKGMGGGIIVLNESLEEKIRTFVKEAPIGDLKVRSWMREVITNSVNPKISSNHSLFLSSAYELLTQFVEPNAIDFSGFPTSIEGIQHIGSERSLRVNLILNFFGKKHFPKSLLETSNQIIPFALPCFFRTDKKLLERVNTILTEMGIYAGIYHIDVNRNSLKPNYKSCILLPCHQNIPLNTLEGAVKQIAKYL